MKTTAQAAQAATAATAETLRIPMTSPNKLRTRYVSTTEAAELAKKGWTRADSGMGFDEVAEVIDEF